MRKLIVVAVLTCVMLGAVSAAQAKTDYRPWKYAMHVWFFDYSQKWLQQPFDWADFGTNTVSIETPPNFAYWVNRWGWGAKQFAQFITLAEGVYPHCEFSLRLQAILRPYLGRTLPDDKPVYLRRHQTTARFIDGPIWR